MKTKRVYSDVPEELHSWLLQYCARERITMRRLIYSLVQALRDEDESEGASEPPDEELP